MIPESEIRAKAEKWLRDNDWDYQKYRDRRPNRDAYNSMMYYEVSTQMEWAFEAGARYALAEVEKRLAEKNGDDAQKT